MNRPQKGARGSNSHNDSQLPLTQQIVYINDLLDTLKRIEMSSWAKTSNQARKKDFLIAGGCLGLFIFSLIMFIASSGGLAAFWCVIFILAILGTGFFVYSGLKLTDARYSRQLKLRRENIRKYLRIENDRYYHRRTMHWKPSPECSYLILKTNYYSEPEDEEIWVTARGDQHIPRQHLPRKVEPPVSKERVYADNQANWNHEKNSHSQSSYTFH